MGIPIFLSFLFSLAQAQIPVGVCSPDACLYELIPSYDNGTAPFKAIESCVSWQFNTATATETEYETITGTSTVTLSGCSPSVEPTVFAKRQESSSSSIAFIPSKGLSTTTCSESSITLAAPTPVLPTDCNAYQVTSICECALNIYGRTGAATTTVAATIYVDVFDDVYLSCSTSTEASSANVIAPLVTGIGPSTSETPSESSYSAPWANSTLGSPVIATSSSAFNASASCPPENVTSTVSGWPATNTSSSSESLTTPLQSSDLDASSVTSATTISEDSSLSTLANATATGGINSLPSSNTSVTSWISITSIISSTSLDLTSSRLSSSNASSVSTYPLPNISPLETILTGPNATTSSLGENTTSAVHPGNSQTSSVPPPFPISNSTESASVGGTGTGSIPLSTAPSNSSTAGSPVIGSLSQTTSILNATELSNQETTVTSSITILEPLPTGYGGGHNNTRSSFPSSISGRGYNNTIGSPVTNSANSTTKQGYTSSTSSSSHSHAEESSSTADALLGGPTGVGCVPSYLNTSWTASGYQAVYAADYSGCALDPFDSKLGFQLHETATELPIVNINGKAQTVRDASEFEDAYYTFKAEGGPCGVFDMNFHWGDEITYLAVYGDQKEVGYEEDSSYGQSGSSDYNTSIWSIDCAGNLRAGLIGGEQYQFNVGPGDRKMRSQYTAFIAPNRRRTVRKRTQGIQMRLVPVNIAEVERRKAMKKMKMKSDVGARGLP